ncbi:hypothetical protein P170DRAFT_441152 [Aspergillus steynii IBT 23096]|uniref:Uncharacterized protein n=1 Tax=Aspergillus steynii IBT 23096 TaxID=1392250 RepID=A0A2I2FSV1_9EURO|nr:uncharacterized protein P170DRAFT_441152 [Aspergillus steynii IBT 23096]PLB43691.1 hypothetical protein P170DRAFT_441152 [Aspergillus steynii IBT 23096]
MMAMPMAPTMATMAVVAMTMTMSPPASSIMRRGMMRAAVVVLVVALPTTAFTHLVAQIVPQ